MRIPLLLLALSAALFSSAQSASAAAFGSSIMNASNVRLQFFNGTTWIDATSTQATLAGSILSSQSTATLGVTTVSSGLVSGLNAPQSFVSPTLPSIAEPTTVPLTGLGASATDSFARGDTLGFGTSIIGGSLATSTLAEVNALGSVTGNANGNVGGTSLFTVNVNQAGQYRLAFTGNLAMQSTADGFANNSFRVQINQSQGATSVSIDYADPLLNRSISGTSSANVNTNFFSPVVTLTAGPIATFSITQVSEVGVTAIPEPSSIAIFSLMSAGSIVAWRRRRNKEDSASKA
jgi:hypothetical protein